MHISVQSSYHVKQDPGVHVHARIALLILI